MPTVIGAGGAGRLAHSRGQPASGKRGSRPSSASRRPATCNAWRRTDVVFSRASTGKQSCKAFDGQPIGGQRRPLTPQVPQLGCGVLGQQLDQRTAGRLPSMLARTAAEPRAPQLELAEQRADDDGLMILGATPSTAGRAVRARGQERADLVAEDLALNCQQERLGFGQRQCPRKPSATLPSWILSCTAIGVLRGQERSRHDTRLESLAGSP
jgi:hypothetical protein